MSTAAGIRVVTGLVGLAAWIVILINGVEERCLNTLRYGTCLRTEWVFNYQEAAMWAALLMAGVISAYVFSRGLD